MIAGIHKKLFRVFLLAGFLALFVSCYKGNVNNNGTVKPNGLTYNYYQDGPGTSISQGSLIFNVHSNNGLLSTEYYQVDVQGVGSYTFPPNTVQLVVPNVWPGTYKIVVTIGCTSTGSASTSNCYLRFLNGTANVGATVTTVVDAFL